MHVGTRASRMVLVSMAVLALSTLALPPVSAHESGVWSMDCKGDASGSASWIWLLNGVPIAGASESATCAGTMTVTGASGRPVNANGITVVVSVSLGPTGDTNSVTKSFDAGRWFHLHLGASMSHWVCLISEERTCLLWAHLHEGVHFSLQG